MTYFILLATSIVSGESVNETWRIDSISDSDASSAANESIDGEDHPVTSEFEELLLSLKTANTNLVKFATIVRNSAAKDDYLQAATRYNFDPQYDIGHVKEKYGTAAGSNDWLLERLGKGITRRRKFLKFRQERYQRAVSNWDSAASGEVVAVREGFEESEDVHVNQEEALNTDQKVESIG
jgi:hypothetical protein